MGHGKWAACVTVVAALTACKAADKSAENREQTAAQRRAENVIVGAKIAAPRAGPANEWPMPGADYSNSRYSELAQITPANAKNPRAAWTFPTGALPRHERQPLAVGNTMYLAKI